MKRGQRISVVFTNVTTSDGGCAGVDLIFRGGGSSAGGQVCGSTGSIGPLNLTSTGTYTILVEVDPTATGSASVQVST